MKCQECYGDMSGEPLGGRACDTDSCRMAWEREEQYEIRLQKKEERERLMRIVWAWNNEYYHPGDNGSEALPF